MAVKLRDVAAQLNLSPSLVSGVLNKRDGVWASEDTRKRIREAALQMGYRPNAAARALRSGKTGTVGLFYLNRIEPDGTINYLPPGYEGVVEVLAEYLGQNGLSLGVKVFTEQKALLATLEESCRSNLYDAFVLWGLKDDVLEQGKIPEKYKIPFVVKGRLEMDCPVWPQIDFDHEALVRTCVMNLAGRGHQRIAYVGYSHNEIFTYRLLDGYSHTMQEQFGIQPPSEYIGRINHSVEQAQSQMEAWLSLPEVIRPTAAVIGSSHTTWNGFELALATRGRRIGFGKNDFAVVGIEGLRTRLLFGEGQAFTKIELANLMVAMAESLLIPLIEGVPLKNIMVRILPELGEIPRWDLLNNTKFGDAIFEGTRHQENAKE